MKNKKIASILLALTICIQNTACMQVKNGGNEISSSVIASSFDNTSEVLEDEDDDEDITKTLQFFLDELSKVKGIEDKIEFSNEEIENHLNTDDAIKCTDKTKWDFETLFAKIEENSNQYALDHPEVHSVFDLYYVDNYASSDDEKYYNLEIMQGIRDGIISEIQTAIENNDQHQLHQFSTLKIVFNNSLFKNDLSTITGLYTNTDNLVEISIDAIKSVYDEYKDCNYKTFLNDAAKLVVMHEMNHAKEWACQDEIENGKSIKFDVRNGDFISTFLEANAENDLYYGKLKDKNPAYRYHDDSNDIAYLQAKLYGNYCEFENLIACINAFDSNTDISEFYDAIYNNDKNKIYTMLNASTDEEKILLNKIMYSFDAFYGRNDYFQKISQLYNFSDEFTDEEYFKFIDTLGNMEYVDILKLSIKNLILYNETNNDLSLKENLILYNFYLNKIVTSATLIDYSDDFTTTDYYLYRELYQGVKQIEDIFFRYLSKRYDISLNDIYLQYNEKDNDEDWLISFNDYFVGGVNRTTIKNLLDKFPKLKMLSVPNYNCYKALESAVNGDEYYDETGYGTKSKLNLRHLS